MGTSRLFLLVLIVLGAALGLGGCGGGGDDGGSPPPPAGGIGGVTVALAEPAAAGLDIKLSWSATGNTAAISEFRALIQRSDAGGYRSLGTGAPAVTTFSFGLLEPTASAWPQMKVKVQACDAAGACVESNEQPLLPVLLAMVHYVKASNTGTFDMFGVAVALSGDGDTLIVGAPGERSAATGIDGNQADDTMPNAGAVYVFTRSPAGWRQQAYLKGSRAGSGYGFGTSLALSADGRTLAVGAPDEDEPARGVLGGRNGAVYVFVRNDAGWSQQARLTAAQPDLDDAFGAAVALSGNGDVLAVGAANEDGSAPGLDGDQTNDATHDAGAVYLFVRGAGVWSQKNYVKASNPGANDKFGFAVALSFDGRTLAVGAYGEASSATGVGGNQADNGAAAAGAVYVFQQAVGGGWAQQAYIKASNSGIGDQFGQRIALAQDGNTLAVAALFEDSAATGIDGNQADESAPDSGAVYVFVRAAGTWTQQSYVKASNGGARDSFGAGLGLARNGDVLVVGAHREDSAAVGVGGDQASDAASDSGAAYVFTRAGATWSQGSYIKAPDSAAGDVFGFNVAVTPDGATFAIAAPLERSAATGVNGNRADESSPWAGVVYVF